MGYCNCIAEMNSRLAQENGKIDVTLGVFTVAEFPTIAVSKIKPRGKRPPLAIPSYCPFCGGRYGEDK